MVRGEGFDPGVACEQRLPRLAMALVLADASQEQQLSQAALGGLGVPVQAVAVVGSPAFPNSIKWSQDNLLAIASGHLVTILVSSLLVFSWFVLSQLTMAFRKEFRV